MAKRTRLAVVDEHAMFRRGVIAVLKDEPWLHVVHESDDGPMPDTVDVVIASPRGFRGLKPGVPAIVCWGPSDPPLGSAMDQPLAIVERDCVEPGQLLAAARALAAGLRVELDGSAIDHALDRQSRDVLQMLSAGCDTRSIADALHYSERTVKALIRKIADRLGARNRAEAVAKAIRLGLI